MKDFELLIALCLVAVVLTAAARRVGAPYPAFLALGGACLALIPGTPRFELRPDLALAVFVAPVLLDSAYDASLRDLKENWAPLLGLVVVAVLLTTLAVALVARWFEPSISWAAAVALGAVVAPPDAAAATAVLHQVRPPHRIVTILEGESLLNDATALLVFRVAVDAVGGHGVSARDIAPQFLFGVVGSIVFGVLIAKLWLPFENHIEDTSSSILMQFVSTFGLWIVAERFGLSPVLTLVAFAISIARRAPDITPARQRVPSYAVWDTVVFVANVLAFVLVGMQIRPVLERLSPWERHRYFYAAGSVLATVVAVRVIWVMAYGAIARFVTRRFGLRPPRQMAPPTLRGAVAVSWCGMRGVVTLAAALALPSGFPLRNLIVVTAFFVVIGTLVVQGLTLKPLLRLLRLKDDDPVAREVDLARARVLSAVLSSFGQDDSKAVRAVREEYEALLQNGSDAPSENAGMTREDAHRRALAAARHVLSELRSSATIGDDAFHRLEEDLDRIEYAALR
ncbi:MAG TPA: sodium:proton antiporter [Polyangiaceae bacterium]|nr:sodium:proton antiporter [Polyangiaceae bacterium]